MIDHLMQTSGERAKVLLVDDREDNLVVLEQLLQRDDVELLKAHSGRQALELLLQHEVALALIDVQMPIMNGLDLAELMRGTERTRHIPIILITASSHSQQYLFKGYEAGAADFLFKPVEPVVLCGKVNTFLELYWQRRQVARNLERLEFFAQATNDAIWERNLQTADVWWSDGISRLFGHAEAVGKTHADWWAERLHDEDRQRVLDGMQAAIEGNGDKWEDAYRFRRADGSFAHVYDRGFVVREGLGKGIRMVGAMLDISERKRIERQVEETREAHLEQLARTVRFSELFVGILGHDLGTPLQGILMAATLIQQNPQAERTVEWANLILNTTSRMDRMIKQILDLTQIRLGRGLPLLVTPTDLGAHFSSLLAEFGRTDGDAAIILESSGDLRGAWDEDRISQLISSLIGNAVKHRTPGTPVTIRIDGGAADVVTVAVHNQGAISPELLPDIFEPFRANTSKINRESSGLGLGLFISHQIVLAHGGTIDVASTPEQGTTLTCRLPRDGSAHASGDGLPSSAHLFTDGHQGSTCFSWESTRTEG